MEGEHENCKKEKENLVSQQEEIESLNEEKWWSKKQEEILKSKVQLYLAQNGFLAEEKETLLEKNYKYEKEIESLKMRCNEASKTVLSKQQLIEEKQCENSELRTKVEDLEKKNNEREISKNEKIESMCIRRVPKILNLFSTPLNI